MMRNFATGIGVVAALSLLAGVSPADDNGGLKAIDPDGTQIVDATGKKVGAASEVAIFGTVLFELNGREFAVGVRKERFVGNRALSYESSDFCLGTPFIEVGGGLFPRVSLQNKPPSEILPTTIGPFPGSPGNNVYIEKAGATPVTKTIESRLTRDDCVDIDPRDRLVVPVEFLIDLDTEFTGPFSFDDDDDD